MGMLSPRCGTDVGWSTAPTPFQELVAEEALATIDEREARAAGIGPLGRFVDDNLALKLLLNVGHRTSSDAPAHALAQTPSTLTVDPHGRGSSCSHSEPSWTGILMERARTC